MAKKKNIIPYGRGYIEENTLRKTRIIADIVAKHYEPGRQDRCLEWVHQHIVIKQYPMSLRTFRRYIKIAVEELGYTFAERTENKDYLFDQYIKMKPESLDILKDICREAQKSGIKNKSELYAELQERIGLNISFDRFTKYLRIGKHCLDYNLS